MQKTSQLSLPHASKVMFKILQGRLQQYMNQGLPDAQASFRKGRETRDQIPNIHWIIGFSSGSDSKVSACNEGDTGLIPGLGRSSGEGNGNPLQYSSLENPMDRGAWQATVRRVAQSQIRLKET